jgi:ribosomal protein L4
VRRDWSIGMNKRVRRMGLRVALAAKHRDRRLVVVDSLAMVPADGGAAVAEAAAEAAAGGGAVTALAHIQDGKTRVLRGLLAAHGQDGRRVLFMDGDHPPEGFRRAIRNLAGSKPLPARGANVQDLLLHEVLVVTPAALDALAEHLGQDFEEE